MSSGIAKREPQAVARAVDSLSEEQREVLTQQVAKGLTPVEMSFFLERARRAGLDPFSKQIYAIKRYDRREQKDVMTIQTAIDGFRLIAQRSGRYEGQTHPEWCGKDGVWRQVWLDDAPPAAARIGVWARGFREPLYGVARWKSYVQTTKDGRPSNLWAQMPDVMLLKCAESAALRKAFPEETSGLYTEDELGQAHELPAGSPAPAGGGRSPAAHELPADGMPPSGGGSDAPANPGAPRSPAEPGSSAGAASTETIAAGTEAPPVSPGVAAWGRLLRECGVGLKPGEEGDRERERVKAVMKAHELKTDSKADLESLADARLYQRVRDDVCRQFGRELHRGLTREASGRSLIQYDVPSESEDALRHVTLSSHADHECSCPSHTLGKRRPCRHIAPALELLAQDAARFKPVRDAFAVMLALDEPEPLSDEQLASHLAELRSDG